MRVVFMGAPEFAVAPLEHLFLNGYQVAAVYTRPDRAAGRGRSLAASPVKQAALRLGLPVVQPDNFKGKEAVGQLAALRPEAIVVAAFGQILPPSVLEIPPLRCVNVHPSLLPRHRGPSPVAAAILAGDRFSGVSIMLMDAGMDTGPMLLQGQVPVQDYDTTGSLTDKLSLVAAHLLLEALPRWERGKLDPRPQDGAGANYSRLLTKDEGEIDWGRPAAELGRRVRAFQPWPECYTRWQGKQLKIIRALPLPGEEKAGPGQVVVVKGGGAAFGVGTGEGVLGIWQVQLEGKKAMPAADFLRGQPRLIGAVLPS